MSECLHEWIDITAFGDTKRQWVCGKCDARAWSPMPPLVINGNMKVTYPTESDFGLPSLPTWLLDEGESEDGLA